MTFAALLVIQKREKRKIFLMPLCGRTLFAPTRESKSRQQPKEKIYPLFRQRTYHIHARLALSAGVQTMRARICSAFSCDMFARVVWLKPRRAAKPPTFTLPCAARTCHAWLARLTRARGGRYVRGRKALLHDFCRAFGHSKAR